MKDSKKPVLSTFADYAPFIGHPTSSINQFTTNITHRPYYQTDQYILDGYRRITNSFRGCLLSLFYIHNESGNVYTHLIASLIMVMFLIFYNGRDYLIYSCFCIGAVACLSTSTTFHLCMCHSFPVKNVLNRLDYVGIIFLIFGSYIAVIYYLFFCSPILQLGYLTLGMILGVSTVYHVNQAFCHSLTKFTRTSVSRCSNGFVFELWIVNRGPIYTFNTNLWNETVI